MSTITALTGQDDTGDFVPLPEAGVTGFGESRPSVLRPPAVTDAATTIAAPDNGDRDVDCEQWGRDNRWPTHVRQAIHEVSMAGQAVDRRVKLLYGNGLYYYRNEDVRDGDNKVKRHYDPAVEAFLRRNRIRTHWYPAQCLDYVCLGNAFTEFITSRDQTRVLEMYHKPAEHCRLSAQDRFGRNRYVLYSPHWMDGSTLLSERVAIRLFQWDDAERFLDEQRSAKYAWHTHLPSLGIINYAVPPHHGLFGEKGWIEISKNVPHIVHTMQTNQVRIKYMILFEEHYFKFRHANWDELDAKDKDAIYQKKVREICTALKGVENYSKTLSQIVRHDALDPNNLKGSIRIEPIDDKLKTDAWIPDADKSDQQIVQGFGNDPSLVGLQPAGGKMGAGSGSDKREAHNLGTTMNTMDQAILLEPLQHVADRNGWGVTFMISHTAHTTLNQDKSGTRGDGVGVEAE